MVTRTMKANCFCRRLVSLMCSLTLVASGVACPWALAATGANTTGESRNVGKYLACGERESAAIGNAESTAGALSSLPADAHYLFLKSLVMPSGLVSRRKNECFVKLYELALAAIAFIHKGDRVLAENIFDVFQSYYVAHKAKFAGFPDGWDPCCGEPDENSDRWEGDNAFLLLALAHYHGKYAGRCGKYWSFVQGLKQWLTQRTASCEEIAAEGVADMYAAFMPFSGNKAVPPLLSKLHDCFFSSGHDSSYRYDLVLDHIVRGALVFGDASGFAYLKDFVRTEPWCLAPALKIKAFDAFSSLALPLDSPHINVEISAQLLLTSKLMNHPLSFDLLRQLKKLVIDGGLPYNVGNSADFEQACALPTIASTFYLLSYYWNFNPFHVRFYPCSSSSFTIRYPADGTRVSQRYPLEIRGVGMKDNVVEFSCRVKTDNWYPQDFGYQRAADGSWKTWANLGGSNQYNKHTIQVVVKYSDGKERVAEVTGIVATIPASANGEETTNRNSF